jgi:hypothetical protein
MASWARGESEIEQLITAGHLERVSGAETDGFPLLNQVRKTVATAAKAIPDDSYSAYVLSYDAARFACVALLAQQGLRATTNGGHSQIPSDTATADEAREAAEAARRLINAATALLPQIAFFT